VVSWRCATARASVTLIIALLEDWLDNVNAPQTEDEREALRCSVQRGCPQRDEPGRCATNAARWHDAPLRSPKGMAVPGFALRRRRANRRASDTTLLEAQRSTRPLPHNLWWSENGLVSPGVPMQLARTERLVRQIPERQRRVGSARR
jgi:hypothetical protein